MKSPHDKNKRGIPEAVDRCLACLFPIWYLGGDPVWEDYDHTNGRPGTTGHFGKDEEVAVPMCLECYNDRRTYERLARRLIPTPPTDTERLAEAP